jgi:hypothetical protein
MTTLETRRYAMLARVRDFGEVHRDLFPESSEGGQAFATVAAAVAQLATHTRSKLTSTRDGRQAKVAAREALRDRLDAIMRTARVIAEKTPGFDDPFHLPRKQDDESLLLACPLFLDEAEAKKERFVGHGLPATFVTDLKVLVDHFMEAVRSVATAKERTKVARKGIAAAQLSGLAAVRQLDVIVVNQLERNPEAMAHWEEARRIEYVIRRRGPATPDDSVPPAAPQAPSAPTSSSAAIHAPSTSADADAGVTQLPKAS